MSTVHEPTANPPFTEVAVITDLAEASEIESDWHRLAAARGNAFITPEWMRVWMAHYGERATPLVVAVRDRSGKLRGVMPWVRHGGRFDSVRFAGANLGDVFHPAALKVDEDAVAEAAFAALTAEGIRPATIVLDRVERSASWLRHLPRGSPSRRAGPVVFREDVLPLVDFGDLDWPGYLASRSRNLRAQIGRKRRALERDHELGFRLSRDPDQVRDDVALCFALHDARWESQGGSAASTEASRRFHADLAAALLKREALRLWFLELDGEAVASWYGWRLGGHYSFYQSGFDPDWASASVGFVLFTETVRAARSEDATVYDLLLGREPYKLRFATGQREVMTVVSARRGHPMALLTRAEAALWRFNRRLPPRVRSPAKSVYKALTRSFPSAARR